MRPGRRRPADSTQVARAERCKAPPSLSPTPGLIKARLRPPRHAPGPHPRTRVPRPAELPSPSPPPGHIRAPAGLEGRHPPGAGGRARCASIVATGSRGGLVLPSRPAAPSRQGDPAPPGADMLEFARRDGHRQAATAQRGPRVPRRGPLPRLRRDGRPPGGRGRVQAGHRRDRGLRQRSARGPGDHLALRIRPELSYDAQPPPHRHQAGQPHGVPQGRVRGRLHRHGDHGGRRARHAAGAPRSPTPTSATAASTSSAPARSSSSPATTRWAQPGLGRSRRGVHGQHDEERPHQGARGPRDVEFDVVDRTLEDGDVVLLCSDGLTNMLPDDRILEIVTAHGRRPRRVLRRARESRQCRGRP